MAKESNKPDWMKKHSCKNCGAEITSLLCPECGKISVKVKTSDK